MLFKPSALVFVFAALWAASASAVASPQPDDLNACYAAAFAVCDPTTTPKPSATCDTNGPDPKCPCECTVKNCNGVTIKRNVCLSSSFLPFSPGLSHLQFCINIPF